MITMKKIDFVKIMETLRKHEDGITLNWDGTVPIGLKGYMVSITNNVLDSAKSPILTMDNISKNIACKSYIGYWKDETGKEYVDISINIKDFPTAYNMGKIFNQQAIYWLDGNQCIEIKEE